MLQVSPWNPLGQLQTFGATQAPPFRHGSSQRAEFKKTMYIGLGFKGYMFGVPV